MGRPRGQNVRQAREVSRELWPELTERAPKVERG